MAKPVEVAEAAREFLRGGVTWEEVVKLASETTFTAGEPEVYGTDPGFDPESWKDTVGLVFKLPHDKLKELRAAAKFV